MVVGFSFISFFCNFFVSLYCFVKQLRFSPCVVENKLPSPSKRIKLEQERLKVVTDNQVWWHSEDR